MSLFGQVRLFHAKLMEIYATQKSYTKPPVSLEGQLLWREFFYTVGFGTKNFDKMVARSFRSFSMLSISPLSTDLLYSTEIGDGESQEGNTLCRQIDWDENEEFFKAWESGKTGYPFVDAIMRRAFQCQPVHHTAFVFLG